MGESHSAPLNDDSSAYNVFEDITEFVPGIDVEKVRLLIDWLKELNKGRVRPDKTGRQLYVRESVDFISIIRKVNDAIAAELGVRDINNIV